MSEICTQSTIGTKHKSKANSYPCILESVLLYTIIHFLDRDFKVKKSQKKNHNPNTLVFNAFYGERKLKTQ